MAPGELGNAKANKAECLAERHLDFAVRADKIADALPQTRLGTVDRDCKTGIREHEAYRQEVMECDT